MIRAVLCAALFCACIYVTFREGVGYGLRSGTCILELPEVVVMPRHPVDEAAR